MKLTQAQYDIVQKWNELLRSGKYEQGQNHMWQIVNGVKKHCCLNVLCEATNEFAESSNYIKDISAVSSPHIIHQPIAFAILLALSTELTENLLPSYMSMNDVDGYTFSEIADVNDELLVDCIIED